jgi:tRNA(Ile)-lysidine synthase
VKTASRLLLEVESFLAHLGEVRAMVVAVSGGPDSVALLRALKMLRRKNPSEPLVIAHLNHQLRGAESDADENFVRELVQRLQTEGFAGLTFRSECVDVAAQARSSGDNLENVARKLRYDWLARVAQEAGSRWVATGHTADDQAETVLHRLLRGTGLRGLSGIPARRELAPEVEVIRPLLRVRRSEVLDYLAKEGQSYRQDSTNLNVKLTRNRIRHELLPLLVENYNPNIADILCRLAGQATEVLRIEEAQARSLLSETELPRAGALLVFDRGRLALVPRHLIREMFRLVWGREGWPQGGMSFDHWERLAEVALGEVAAVDLPDGIRAWRRERVVQISRVL